MGVNYNMATNTCAININMRCIEIVESSDNSTNDNYD